MKRYRTRLFAFSGLILFLILSVALGEVIYIPADYLTIQAGINAAHEGDTVLVAPGIYQGEGNFELDFLGKALLLISEIGAESTIVDAQGRGRGIVFQSSEDENSIIEGFTLTNCRITGETYGGGIFCTGSSPTIRSNIISNCQAYYGAGIGLWNSSPLIEGNEISENSAIRGGGIGCYNGSNAIIDNNVIVDNFSQGR